MKAHEGMQKSWTSVLLAVGDRARYMCDSPGRGHAGGGHAGRGHAGRGRGLRDLQEQPFQCQL